MGSLAEGCLLTTDSHVQLDTAAPSKEGLSMESVSKVQNTARWVDEIGEFDVGVNAPLETNFKDDSPMGFTDTLNGHEAFSDASDLTFTQLLMDEDLDFMSLSCGA